MRKRAKRRHETMKSAPMLVMRGLCNDRLELRERAAIEAFALGYATSEHFDTILDMQSVMILAGSTSDARKWAMDYARDEVGPVLLSIKQRYGRTQKMGCTGDELAVLRGFVSKYRDFWLRQPLELYLYIAACEALQRHYDELTKREAA